MGPQLGLLLVLLAACAVMVKTQYSSLANIATTPEFRSFQGKFLLVYLLVTASDWIQGPYLYKLYSFYGFTKSEIGFLFVSGFLSSAVFGTLVGGLADRVGRKKVCLAFCLLYALSCGTKHSSDFNILFAGRILGGISTSILCSVFEAQMVHEHKHNAYPDEWLVKTLSYMTLLSSLGAVLCAVVAEAITTKFGYVAPFDASIVLLVLAALCILKFSSENYGDNTIAPCANFAVGWVVLASNAKIWILGLIQSCFEGCMYIFVFSWTPILEQTEDDEIPHGLIFGCFMVAIMLGTYVYQFALKKISTERILLINSIVAAGALLLPAFSKSHMNILVAFCVFEVCVGVYFPAIAYLRSKHIPEEVRATILNFFRIPLNLIVVLVLLNIGEMSTAVISFACAGLLGLTYIAQQVFSRIAQPGADDGEDNSAREAMMKVPPSPV